MKKETETRLTREKCLEIMDIENDLMLKNIVMSKDKNYYFFNGKIWEQITLLNLRIEIKNHIHEKLPTDKYIYSVQIVENYILNKFLHVVNNKEKIDVDKNIHRFYVFENGVLDIMSMTLKPHEEVKTQYLTIKLDFDYMPDAKLGPVADKMLKKLFSDKSEKEIRDIYLHIGYIINPNKNYDRILINYGRGCTGKSTFLKFIANMVGSGYKSTKLRYLSAENNRFFFSDLKDKIVIADDDVSSYEWNTNNLKSISGTKEVASDVKFGNPMKYNLRFGIILNVNRLPFISDLAYETVRRFFFIKFNVNQKRQNTMAMEYQLDIEKENNFSYFLNLYLNNQDEFADLLDDLDVQSHNLLRQENVLFSFLNDCFKKDINNHNKITPQTMCNIYHIYSMNKKIKPYQLWENFKNDLKLKLYTVNTGNNRRFYKLTPNEKFITQMYKENCRTPIINYYADNNETEPEQEPKTEQEPKNESSLF